MASLPVDVGDSFGFEGTGTISATQRRLLLGRAPFAEDLRLFGTPHLRVGIYDAKSEPFGFSFDSLFTIGPKKRIPIRSARIFWSDALRCVHGFRTLSVETFFLGRQQSVDFFNQFHQALRNTATQPGALAFDGVLRLLARCRILIGQ